MKPSISVLLLLILLLIPGFLSAQSAASPFHQGSWEFNLTGSFGSINNETEFSSAFYNGSVSEDFKYFQIGIIPGYYITQGLSFEPEINMFAIEGSKPAYMLLGNVGYTFTIENSMFYPFVHAGYGVTNAFQIPVNTSLSLMSHKLDIGVLNLGAGLKTKLSESILLRTEINYRKYSYSPDEAVYGASYSMNLSSIALVFGFSFLL